MISDRVKITYLICSLIADIFLLTMAIFTPVYLAIDMYGWSVLFMFIFFITSSRFSKRLDSWGYKND